MNILKKDIKKILEILYFESKVGPILNPNDFIKNYNIKNIKIDELKDIVISIKPIDLKKININSQDFNKIIHHLIGGEKLPIKIIFQRDLVNQDEHFSYESWTDPNEHILFLIQISKEDIKKLEHIVNELSGSKDNNIKSLITNSDKIREVDVLRFENDNDKVTIYVNSDYKSPISHPKGKYWGLFYDLAVNQSVSYNKNFFGYFNSSKLNPLHNKYGFAITRILKKDGDYIVPCENLKIETISQKTAATRINKA